MQPGDSEDIEGCTYISSVQVHGNGSAWRKIGWISHREILSPLIVLSELLNEFFSVLNLKLNNKVTKYVNVVGMIDSNILAKLGFGKMI